MEFLDCYNTKYIHDVHFVVDFQFQKFLKYKEFSVTIISVIHGALTYILSSEEITCYLKSSNQKVIKFTDWVDG